MYSKNIDVFKCQRIRRKKNFSFFSFFSFLQYFCFLDFIVFVCISCSNIHWLLNRHKKCRILLVKFQMGVSLRVFIRQRAWKCMLKSKRKILRILKKKWSWATSPSHTKLLGPYGTYIYFWHDFEGLSSIGSCSTSKNIFSGMLLRFPSLHPE